MAYKTAAALRAALEARLQNEARQSGVDLERLRRRTVFERLLTRLEAASPGGWVVKGGMALEFRLHDRARSTRDLDLALREPTDDGDLVRELLIDALGRDADRDGFAFAVGRPAPISADEAGRPGWRFPVEALLAGRRFATVRLDVVSRQGETLFTGRLLLPGALAFAGIAPREIEAVEPAQHFAEKLHALTRRYGDRPSSRVRDLPTSSSSSTTDSTPRRSSSPSSGSSRSGILIRSPKAYPTPHRTGAAATPNSPTNST